MMPPAVKQPAKQAVALDLNAPGFLRSLLDLDKTERNHVLNTLGKLIKLDWDQLYRDPGLKWEKINSVTPPAGFDAIYSLRITQSRRALAVRDGNVLRMLLIAADHDAAYGKK
jgi:hypothetical protein